MDKEVLTHVYGHKGAQVLLCGLSHADKHLQLPHLLICGASFGNEENVKAKKTSDRKKDQSTNTEDYYSGVHVSRREV